MTEDELVELNEARLANHWGTWSCQAAVAPPEDSTRWIAARTREQALEYCTNEGWKWSDHRVFGVATTTAYVEQLGTEKFGIDVVLP